MRDDPLLNPAAMVKEAEESMTLSDLAKKIRPLLRKHANNAMELGAWIEALFRKVSGAPRKAFLRANFDMGERQAWKYIRAHRAREKIGETTAELSALSPSLAQAMRILEEDGPEDEVTSNGGSNTPSPETAQKPASHTPKPPAARTPAPFSRPAHQPPRPPVNRTVHSGQSIEDRAAARIAQQAAPLFPPPPAPEPGRVTCPMCRGKATVTEKQAAAVKFIPPTREEVAAYCEERRNKVDPEAFIAHYESNGWMVGKSKMKSWKGAIITWEKNDFNRKTKPEQFSTIKEWLQESQNGTD